MIRAKQLSNANAMRFHRNTNTLLIPIEKNPEVRFDGAKPGIAVADPVLLNALMANGCIDVHISVIDGKVNLRLLSGAVEEPSEENPLPIDSNASAGVTTAPLPIVQELNGLPTPSVPGENKDELASLATPNFNLNTTAGVVVQTPDHHKYTSDNVHSSGTFTAASGALKAVYEGRTLDPKALEEATDAATRACWIVQEQHNADRKANAEACKENTERNKILRQLVHLSSPADVFELYDSLGAIDRGSFGVVFPALPKTVLGDQPEMVAIKYIDLRGQKMIQSLVNEIAITRDVCHPNIVRSFSSHMRGDKDLFIVMEYMTGMNLASLRKCKKLKERHIATVCREVLQGLEYLHSQKIMHRDVKGSNVMMDKQGHVKLIDLGSSVHLPGPGFMLKGIAGSAGRMAPEMLTGDFLYDERADIYSLGIMVIELVDNRIPHRRSADPIDLGVLVKAAETLNTQPPKLSRLLASRQLKKFLAACVEPDMDKRLSAKKLLDHKFLRKAGPINCLIPLLASTHLT